MANRIDGSKRGASARAEPTREKSKSFASPIHELLDMTPEQVEADIVSRGKTPAGVAKAFGRMEKKVRAEFSEIVEDKRAGAGAALRRDFLMDSAASFASSGKPASRFDQVSASKMLAAAKTFDDRHRGSIAMATARRFEAGVDWAEDDEVVMLDTSSGPRDGDLVLAHVEGDGQVLRRLALLGDGRIALEPVDGQAGEREIGAPSNFVVYGVVVGRSHRD